MSRRVSAPRRRPVAHLARALAVAAGLVVAGALPACAGLMLGGPATEGHRLYLSKCTTCHRAYDPAHFTPDHWRAAVAKMARKGRVHLSEHERAAILGYLTGTEAGKTAGAPGHPAPAPARATADAR